VRGNALAGKVFVDDYLVEFILLIEMLLHIGFNFPFEYLE
jgi:hypothetical protein